MELDKSFNEVVRIIDEARNNAYRKVNEELILMYSKIGQFLSEKSKEAAYGVGYVDSMAEYIHTQYPGIKGFNRRGLYRMKQFYELYAGNEKVSTLLTLFKITITQALSLVKNGLKIKHIFCYYYIKHTF